MQMEGSRSPFLTGSSVAGVAALAQVDLLTVASQIGTMLGSLKQPEAIGSQF